MGRLVTLATCSLNQWVLDWNGNAERIIESVRRAKAAGAMLRVGPELEITGYGCLDHFLESDTFLHSWEMLARIMDHEDCQDIIVDVGMPVRHRNCRYNARVIFYNKKIILIRPKSSLANDGNYREMRYFSPWLRERYVEKYYLESVVAEITGQRTVPFGDAIISTLDTAFAAETCEELFTPNPPHIPLGLDGCEIFTNSSGSHFEIRKILRRLTLIREATQQNKGIYLYANQQGCDGDRMYYDGCAMILVNGKVVAQGSQFSLNDVEVVTATVDLEEVRAARFAPSRGMQVQKQEPYPRLEIDVALSSPKTGPSPLELGPSTEISLKSSSPPEEIAQCCAMWLWDYLRRCGGGAGYFIALSGGIDSCATATLVFSMCRMVHLAIHNDDTDPSTRAQVIADCRRICDQPADSSWLPSSPQDICSRIFHTSFMGTVNSSTETRSRAKALASAIGAYHIDCDIDSIVSALTTFFTTITSFTPRFKQNGGTPAEGLALQNIQARLRMGVSYLFAQLLPTVRKRRSGGGLLVLGSANVDEQLRGYLTKYDCSAADINPIGGISKTDLKAFIAYARDEFDMPILHEFLEATPTAELEPISKEYVQSDEVDMGMTYAELSVFGRLRKVHKLGPWGMYEKLVYLWGRPVPQSADLTPSSASTSTTSTTPSPAAAADAPPGIIQGRGLSPREVYEKVRRFFYFFNVNRHKSTILPPSLHLEEYSPEDNRFDLRPFLYPPVAGNWPVEKIEEHVRMLEEKEGQKAQ
jgi:NAD+ synthase (glutamine-hydrolysing)